MRKNLLLAATLVVANLFVSETFGQTAAKVARSLEDCDKIGDRAEKEKGEEGGAAAVMAKATNAVATIAPVTPVPASFENSILRLGEVESEIEAARKALCVCRGRYTQAHTFAERLRACAK